MVPGMTAGRAVRSIVVSGDSGRPAGGGTGHRIEAGTSSEEIGIGTKIGGRVGPDGRPRRLPVPQGTTQLSIPDPKCPPDVGSIGRPAVGVLKVGGIFVHKSERCLARRIPTPELESIMPSTPVPPEKQAEIEDLARAIRRGRRRRDRRTGRQSRHHATTPTSSATMSSRSATWPTRSPPRPSSSTWRKKKRIRRGQRDLPALRPGGRVPLAPRPHPAEPRRSRPLPPRLLPLPPLRQGALPLR